MLAPLQDRGKPRRQRRPDTGRLHHRVGEFGGMRGAERDYRGASVLCQSFARGTNADGAVRIEDVTGVAISAGDLVAGRILVDGGSVEIGANGGEIVAR